LTDSGYITKDLRYLPGALGCAVSHLKLWEMAASEDRSITVFEDDVAVSYGFYQGARSVFSAVPEDWDIIQWGCVLNPLFIWVDLGISKVRLHCYGERHYSGPTGSRQFQTQDVNPTPVRLLHSFGTMGYSISAKGARAALKYCLPLHKRLIQFPGAGVA